MSVSFVPNIPFTLVCDLSWSVDSYDIDHCKATWRGPRPNCLAFINGLQRWSQLSGYPQMFLASWDNEPMNTYPFPTVTLNYIGFRSGVPPPAKVEDGYSSQTFSTTYTDPDSGDTYAGSFAYKAARTTYSFLMTSQPPQTPPTQYSTVTKQFATPPLSQQNIIRYSIVNQTSPDGSSIDIGTYTAVLNTAGAPIMFVSDYKRPQLVPNKIWQCSCTVDFMVSGQGG